MSTDSREVKQIPAPSPQQPTVAAATEHSAPILQAEAQTEQATVAAEVAANPESQAAPYPPSSAPLVGRSFARWVWSGIARVFFRSWTRVAARAFPEDSELAAFATQLGVPLPDRLNLSWITHSLAVGGRIRPADITRLRKIGVTRVVDTRSEHKDDAAALAAQGIELLYLPTPDTYPLTIEQLHEGAAWINQQIDDHQRVLVHCEHGVGRSVLLATAALVGSGMPAQEALDLVQEKRWQAAPNRRQIVRLQEFEHALHRK